MSAHPSNGHYQHESIIEFPCEFILKIMGKSQGDFESITVSIIKKHFPSTDFSYLQKKFSRDKNYLSLSVTVYVESKRQLDNCYRELSSIKEVLMVL